MSSIVYAALFFVGVNGGAFAATNDLTIDNHIEGVTCDSSGNHFSVAQNSYGSGHIYYSEDAGMSWSISDAPDEGYVSISMDPSANNYLAAAAYRDVVLISGNSGRNWTDITGTLTFDSTGVSVANGGQTVVVLDEDAIDGQCMYITKNAGLAWSGPLGPTVTTEEECIASALNGDGSVIVISIENIGLYVSSNVGTSWQQVYTVTDDYSIYSILYNPSLAVFYASQSGPSGDYPPIIKSDTSALVWTAVPTTLPTTSRFDPMGFGVSSSGDEILITAGDPYYSTDSGSTYYKAVNVAGVVYYACMNSDASRFLYATNSVVYTTDSLPEPDDDDDDDDEFSSLSCSDSPCPTSCPYGYSGGYSMSGCDVYCKSQPSNGQCLPGGSGCDSSCRSAGELAGIIIGAVLGFLLIVGLIIFVVYKCCRNRTPETSKTDDKQEISVTSVFHNNS